MNEQEKQEAMILWQTKWDIFIDSILYQYNHLYIPNIVGWLFYLFDELN